MGLSLRPLGKKIVDIFSADTQEDQRKRVAAGQPRMYADQQRAMGNKRPATNVGAAFLGGTARLINTGVAAGRELSDTARMIAANATNNPEAFSSVSEQNRRFKQRMYQPNSGLFGAGTIFDKPEEFNTLGAGDITKRVGAATLGTAGETLPVGQGLSVAKQGMRVLPKVAAQGAAVGTVGSVGDQYLRTGKIDPKQVALAAGTGGVLAAAPPAVVAGARKLPKAFAKEPRPYNRLQTQIEQAHNAGDAKLEAKLVEKLPDQGMNPNATLTPERRAEVMAKAGLTPSLPKVTAKTRGFAKNVARSSEGNPTAETVVESIPGYKPITNKQTLTRAANEIQKDPAAAFARVATKPQLTTADDVAAGNLLLRDAIEKGDIESAIQLGAKLGIDGTKLGQAVQAYATWKKTTPEGVLRYATKKAGGAGRQLDSELGQQLVNRAKEVASMPEGLERAKATRELLAQADSAGRTWKDTASEILNVPRSIMATADFSAPLRQGAVLGSRFPREFGRNFTESAKYFFRPGAYEQAMYDITQRPSYALMKSHKLAVTGAQDLTSTEELFLSSVLESGSAKKLGVGHLVAASSRAYSGFLTKLRADVFDKVVQDSQAAGVKLDKKALDSLAKFVNSASGRGSGNLLDKHVGLLSQALFSPRLWKSRIDTINPVYYARLDPVARKYALQSAGAFFSIVGTVLGLAALAGADVEADPRSADFAKVKVGNTRYDVLGGIQQNARLAAQLITGQKINSETGELQTLGPERGYGKPSRLDLLYQFFENKENPVVSFGSKMLRQTDAAGNPINPATEAAKLVIPLNAQSTYETAKDQGSLAKGVAMTLPGVFGVGVQTYGAKKDQAEKDSGRTAKSESLAKAKEDFKKGSEPLRVVGDNVLRRRKDGSVQVTPKLSYDYSLNQNKLQAAKKEGNIEKWFKIADAQYKNLQKQLQDPTLDELERSTIEEKLSNLVSAAEKYQQYGGFKKARSSRRSTRSSKSSSARSGGRGGKGSTGSAFKYAVSPTAGGESVKPRVTVKKGGGVKSKVKKASAPKVSIKKSRV